jgi:hypothetical protein
MNKQIYILFFLATVSVEALAQNDLTFYHFGKATPQANHLNPSYFPDSKVYVSLPVISGINASINNSFSYNDILIEADGGDSLKLDVDNFLSKLKRGSSLNFNANISLFQFGVRLRDYGAITVFANERVNGGMIYPRDLLEYAWRGNGEYIGETFTESNVKVNATHFREYGIGYAHQFEVLGVRKLRVGARIKMIQGLLNTKSGDNLSIDLTTEPDRYNLNIALNDPAFYTAGIDAIDNDEGDNDTYFISNANKGVGFDLGAELELNEKINISLAINDIGSINWKEEVRNYTVTNSTVDFSGLDLRNLDDITDALEDTLSNKFNDQENTNSYSTSLSTRTFIGGTYQVLPKGKISATIVNYFQLGKPNTSFGVGYTHEFGKILTLSGTIAKKPHQNPAFGSGFAARFGFFQMYAVVDNLFGFTDARKIQTVDFKFGINFLFSRKDKVKESSKKEKKELEAIPEEYQDDETNNNTPGR